MAKLLPILVAIVLSSGLWGASDAEIGELVAGLKSRPERAGGVYPGDDKLAKPFLDIGASAIPHLLPLLEDPRQPTREIAAYIVMNIPGITEEHLTQWRDDATGAVGKGFPFSRVWRV